MGCAVLYLGATHPIFFLVNVKVLDDGIAIEIEKRHLKFIAAFVKRISGTRAWAIFGGHVFECPPSMNYVKIFLNEVSVMANPNNKCNIRWENIHYVRYYSLLSYAD